CTFSELQADTLRLIDGGMISGKLLNDAKSEVLKIQTSDGMEIEIARTQCKDIRITGEREAKYVELVNSKDDSHASHQSIARECAGNSQKLLSMAHLERAVELDPTDKNSWVALDYAQSPPNSGIWVKKEVLAHSKGLVERYKGRGYTTQYARAMAEADDRINRAKHQLEDAIDRHYKNRNQTTNRGIEARTFFSNLTDVMAIDEISKRIKEELAKGRIDDLWMSLLAQMPGSSASGALIDLAINANNTQVEDQCLTLLVRTPDSTEIAFSGFMSALAKPELRDRAARHLESLQDPRAIPVLIRSLVSVKKITQSGPNTSVNTSGGMTLGNNTKTMEIPVNHQSVLQALNSLTGQNFSYERDKWLYWYASEYADVNLDLRRNP
ncbi:MAG: hypothetical protein ABL921_32020, partial [Pirellula sp.]